MTSADTRALDAPLLIVDDEEAILFAMKEYFESLGYPVDSASELEQARVLLGGRRYAVVIADLRLTTSGGSEGLDLMAQVREGSPRTRTILLTAYGSFEMEAQVRALGVDLMLLKPQPLERLARHVRELLAIL